MTITGNFECFRYFNFEVNVLKNENLSLKTGVKFFRSTNIENASLPYKTTLSEVNVKTNRIEGINMDLSQRTKFLCNFSVPVTM